LLIIKAIKNNKFKNTNKGALGIPLLFIQENNNMSAKAAPTNFINDLERVAQTRLQVSQSLGAIAKTLEKVELEGEKQSGKLELSRDIEDIAKASQALQNGVFRLLVLEDMKRGKSTFLNTLIGEQLLPSDVNPCTAILTILRYGLEKK